MSTFECRLMSISSYHQSESDGDEIFIKINKKKIWPEKEKYSNIDEAVPTKINHAIPLTKLEGIIEVELWEYDNIISSSCLGKFPLALSETGGPYTTDLKLTSKEFAQYSLTWEVIKKSMKS